MGSLFTKLFENFYSKKDCKILMLGLDAAGKTTILYQMKLGENAISVPTILNFETYEYKKFKFVVFDVVRQSKLRLLWKHYFPNTNALIYVVDSSDSERFSLAKETLKDLLQEEELKECPVLVFANKQDMAKSTPLELVKELSLNKLLKGREWFLQGCCALTRDGLYDGIDWLSKTLQR